MQKIFETKLFEMTYNEVVGQSKHCIRMGRESSLKIMQIIPEI